jgi:hypothetical protein
MQQPVLSQPKEHKHFMLPFSWQQCMMTALEWLSSLHHNEKMTQPLVNFLHLCRHF